MTTLRDVAGTAANNIGLLLDAVPDPMIVTSVEGEILRVSRSAARLLGYGGADLKGRPLSDLISEELRQEYVDHRIAFLASGEETGPELETRFVSAGNSVLPIDASVGRMDMGDTTYVLLVMREVSDRLTTQNRLERMVAIDDLTTSISSGLSTPDSDMFDEAIATAITELGVFCDASAYLFMADGTGHFALHSEWNREESSRGIVALGLEALPWVRSLLSVASISNVKTTGPIPDAAVADSRALFAQGVTSLVVIPLRASGLTFGFVGIESTDPDRPAWPGEDLAGLIVLQDVFENALERKRIGSELRTVNRVLRAVSECHDTLIRAQNEKDLLRDVCRIVVEAGGYALAWVGYALDNEARQIEAQAQWGVQEGFIRKLKLTWKDEGVGRGAAGTSIRTRTTTVVHDTSDPTIDMYSEPRSEGFLSLVTVPLFYRDEVAGVLAVYDREVRAFDARGVEALERFADDLAYGIAALRARKRQKEIAAQLRDLLESKDQLIATIAHELRTPLAGVVGFAQVLCDDDALDEESRGEMVRMIAEQGRDLTNIVDDLLVAAKSDAGTLVVASIRVDLHAQAAQVIEAWGSDGVGRIELSGSSAVTTGDPARVRQILRNLITNAFRYGGQQITVRVGGDETTGYVSVEDNGPGVDEGEEDRIFEPYKRAHNAPGVTASMGLGLSISRQLAQRMGGDLLYRREPEHSVFTLSIPTLVE